MNSFKKYMFNENEYDFTVKKEGNFVSAIVKQFNDGQSIKGNFTFNTRSLGISNAAVKDMVNKVIRIIEDELDNL